MNVETGEIRGVEEIPKEKLGEWSEPFYVGKVVVRVKKLRGEIVLRKHR